MSRNPAILSHVRRMLEMRQAQRLEDVRLLELFLERRDEEAFAEMVRRHGPLVLGVCRRVLRDPHDADDVFQATFFVFARKADSIRKHASLSSWLYGVAYRLSLKCRAGARRRHEREQPFLDHERETGDDVSRLERLAVLDEELQRLPERQRAPLLLCYAEGKSQDEAARELGWSRGTLKRRLERGRDILRDRLTRRGLALSAAGLTQADLLAAVPATLTATTAKLAALMTAPEAIAATAVSAQAALLAKGMMQSMFLGKVKTASALVLMLGLLGIGTGVVARQTFTQPAAPERRQAEAPAREDAKPKRPDQKNARLDADGVPLPEEALARFGSTRLKHGGMIGFLHFMPDGKTLISQGDDCMRVWDVATGRQIRQLPGESGNWRGASPDPDSGLIATTFGTGREGGIRLWDVQRGEAVRTIGAGINTERRVCFSPDGKKLASAGHPHLTRLELWDASTGANLRSWGAEAPVAALAFVPDGKTLITVHGDKIVRFWEVATGKELRRVSVVPNVAKAVGSPNDSLSAVFGMRMALSPNGSLLAVFGTKVYSPTKRDKCVHVIDVANGKEVRQLILPQKLDASNGLGALAFSPDGKALFAGGTDDHLFVWNPATGEELHRYPDGFPRLGALAIAPDGNTLAAAVDNKTIRLFDLKKNQFLFPTAGHLSEVSQVGLASNGKLAATNAREKAICVWDPANGHEIRRLEGTTLEIAADDRTLISQDTNKSVRFWDLASDKELRKLAVGDKPFWGHALSPDGKTLAVMGLDDTIRLHHAVTGKLHSSWKTDGGWVGMAFSSDSNDLIAWSRTHVAHVWDPKTGQERRRFPLNPPIKFPLQATPQGHTLAFAYQAQVSADGRWIAYANRGLVILDVADGQVVLRVDGLADGVGALAFSPDRRTLAWADLMTPTIHLLELATGKERHRFTSEGGRVLALAFAADGNKLISGKQDTTALVWDLTGKLATKDSWGKALTPTELDARWSDLAGDDAVQAYRAIRRLAAAPAQAVPYLRERVKPAPGHDAKQVARWVADLDSNDFQTRAKATSALEQLDQNESVADLYRKTLEGKPSLETGRRLTELLDKQRQVWMNLNPERRRIVRALEVLERAGTTEARRVLATLAQGAPGSYLTATAQAALDRLAKRAATP